MNYSDAEALVNSYIEQYLPERGYTFEWMSALRTNGQCSYREKKIRLSSQFVGRNPESEVEKTIIHEIAHALCPGHGHDIVWKSKCISLGGSGSRVNRTCIQAETPYIGKCPNGHSMKYVRRPKKEHSCGVCSNKFDRRFLITVQPNPNFVRER